MTHNKGIGNWIEGGWVVCLVGQGELVSLSMLFPKLFMFYIVIFICMKKERLKPIMDSSFKRFWILTQALEMFCKEVTHFHFTFC